MGQSVCSLTRKSNQVCGNGDCNLFRRDRANVDANRRMYPIEQIRGQAFFAQSLENLDLFAFGANHSDITRARLNPPTQQTHVIAMASSNDDNIRRLVGIEFFRDLIELKRVHFMSCGESLLRSVRGTIVGDDDFKSRIRSRLTKIESYVTCTENVK